jgi:hypothetical protein
MDNLLTDSYNFKNWQRTGGIKHSIPVTWNEEYKNFDWQETYQTNEIPKDDQWNTIATGNKLELEKLYQQWNVSKESTLHYMSLNPNLPPGLEKILDQFDHTKRHYNFLKLTASHLLFWHFDSYATFLKNHEISHKDYNKISRSAVVLTPWSFGQVIQIGNNVYSNWNPGDVFTWNGDTWHGAANFGVNDLVVMQITYL